MLTIDNYLGTIASRGSIIRICPSLVRRRPHRCIEIQSRHVYGKRRDSSRRRREPLALLFHYPSRCGSGRYGEPRDLSLGIISQDRPARLDNYHDLFHGASRDGGIQIHWHAALVVRRSFYAT